MLYALCAADGSLFAGLADGRLYRSDNGGDGWRELELEGGPVGGLLALAPVTAADRGKLRRVAEVEVRQADITKLDVDAIANAANTELRHGGGVAGAIVRAGGRVIQDQSDDVAPIELGDAVETSAGELPSKWVIHAATMELGGPTSADIIRRATASTLRKADELGAKSVGLVAFGTGVGGFPVDEAARIEVEEVRRHLDAGSEIDRVVFAVFGDDARRAFEDALAG